MGSNKIGKACPSRMEVTKENHCITVHLWKTHVGHSIDIGRRFLSKETRTEIAGKLGQGVSLQRILDDVRNCEATEEGLQRIHVLEKKDIYNITRDFNISYSTKQHKDDAISIKLWVHQMQVLDEDSPVIYYKEQGQEDESGVLLNDDFMLVIMTSSQARQLKKFGNSNICIDGTHGTNSYDFQLYTIMTVDEFGSGCPVAFCFSNRSDESSFKLFFEYVKVRVGVICAAIFMSDDAPAFYNAWSVVMSQVPHRLLCIWHVDRKWRQNLGKLIGGAEKKALVYKTLRIFLQLTSIEKFEESLKQLLEDLFSDSDTVTFAQYFQTYYANHTQCWAYCYRLGLGINTNMYLESLHKRLKHFYLEGKKVKRLDKSINAIMKIARDSLFTRLIKLSKNTPTEKSNKIKQSHKVSESISLEMIESSVENEWLVTSSDLAQQYLVIREEEACLECPINCTECNICIHSFKCSCIHNVIKLNICKHIHACAKLINNQDSSLGNNNTYNINNTSEISELLEVSIIKNPAPASSADAIKRKADLIIGLTDKADIGEEEANTILKHLDML